MANHDLMENTVREAIAAVTRMQRSGETELTLKVDLLDTPIGALVAAGDNTHLYLLSYIDQTNLVRKIALIQKNFKASLECGKSASTEQAFQEITEYFAGKRQIFQVPLALTGSIFQRKVWEELLNIPFGKTITYVELANSIGKPAAFRAAAQANAQNPLSIIVPCHRVINANGDLGGYNGGVDRKRFLLDFESTTGEQEGAQG